MAPPKILVVEDDSIQREGIRVVLTREGYAVELASSPSEALAWLGGPDKPDLILLDMLYPRNPEGDGWHFLYRRQQSAKLRSIPVLITTALGAASDEWAAALGADGLLRKPMGAEPLLANVRRCLPPS